MERKIGEVFDYNDVKLIVKNTKNITCKNCYFNGNHNRCLGKNRPFGECFGQLRNDKKEVIFKKATIIDRIKYFIKTRIFKTN